MKIKASLLPGCHELQLSVLRDLRGSFVKTFHHEWFVEHEMDGLFLEEYYSLSHRGVLRGLHFQLPPHDHSKLIYCIVGRVLDVGVDIRRGSPTYGKALNVELSAETANAVYLSAGVAHGFYVLSETATIVCKTSSVYSQAHDAGVRWDSIDFRWPDLAPTLSERDRALPALAAFDSPFVFGSPSRCET